MNTSDIARLLRRAADLRRTRHLTDAEYGALAIVLVHELHGDPVSAGSRIYADQMRKWDLTQLGEPSDDPEVVFGPHRKAAQWVAEVLNPRVTGDVNWFIWGEPAAALYERARVRLRASGRLGLNLDAWVSRQRTLFPSLAPWVERVILAVGAYVLGLLTARLLP
jgi:hypothetical protein